MERIYEYIDDDFYLHLSKSECPDPDSTSFSMQLHDKYELYCCLSGEGEYIVEGNAYRLEPGMVMILRSGEAHSLHISPNVPYKRIALLFSPRIIEKSGDFDILLEPFKAREIGHGNCFSPDKADTSFVVSCLSNMTRPCHTSAEKRMQIEANLPAALAYIRQLASGGEDTAEKTDDGIVGEVAAYINAHLTERWTLSDLQSSLHRNKDYLNRRFREAMGSSIWEYTVYKRIIAARQDIVEGYPIDKVYEKSGFSDYSAFYRRYKAVTGRSPSDDAKNAEIAVKQG